MSTASGSASNCPRWRGVFHRSRGGKHGSPHQQLRQLFGNCTPRGNRRNDSAAQPPAPPVSLDCEMVGCGLDGSISALARVSICNAHGDVLLDEIVKPDMRITDFRQHVTGLSWAIIRDRGISFEAARTLVTDLIRGKVLVGHALQHDLQVLALDHPVHMIRDTSKYKPLRPAGMSRNAVPSLRRLAESWLNREIQTGAHSSVEDCRAAMDLYLMFQAQWERQFVAVTHAQEPADPPVEECARRPDTLQGAPKSEQSSRKRSRPHHRHHRKDISEMYDSDDSYGDPVEESVAKLHQDHASSRGDPGDQDTLCQFSQNRTREHERGGSDLGSGTRDSSGIDFSGLTRNQRKRLRKRLRSENAGDQCERQECRK
ncbi:suppressor of mitotic defects protein [Besnoitia besnoiti]|uniref:RNA exonuclease 4 n=1 Tax=Besnoitia besnoiti TaxID=94643 RepID=A0A2A9LZT0_BESBE|nr:suppressor of mitotic defects protein [Besnoitia besnoiti]PFH31878.1 suppressor of mitotic defects protein [Besnoitia besnoiti]